jgi:AbrB family looped-hinge helix DNA binding protein
MPLVRVSTKGQIVIPKEIRTRLGIKPGTYMSLRSNDNEVTLTPFGDDPVEAAYGMFAHLGPITQDLLDDRREERELEERKLQRWLKPRRS